MAEPLLSIVVLNWNRQYLLRTTVLSLMATTRIGFELIIVDNNSTDGSQKWMQTFRIYHPDVKILLQKENIGGLALNPALEMCRGKYILISENDLEYLPGWDIQMLRKFEQYSDLGQISPFAPDPQAELGEVWSKKGFERVGDGDEEILLATGNVGTTSLVTAEIIKKGIRWKNQEHKKGVKFPSDLDFSADIRAAGYKIAWSSAYQAINWGHNSMTWELDRAYYLKNWEAKSDMRIDGLASFNSAGEGEQTSESLKLELGKALQQVELLKRTLHDQDDRAVVKAYLETDAKLKRIENSYAYRIAKALLYLPRWFLKILRQRK